jgi:hypothetical protein
MVGTDLAEHFRPVTDLQTLDSDKPHEDAAQFCARKTSTASAFQWRTQLDELVKLTFEFILGCNHSLVLMSSSDASGNTKMEPLQYYGGILAIHTRTTDFDV